VFIFEEMTNDVKSSTKAEYKRIWRIMRYKLNFNPEEFFKNPDMYAIKLMEQINDSKGNIMNYESARQLPFIMVKLIRFHNKYKPTEEKRPFDPVSWKVHFKWKPQKKRELPYDRKFLKELLAYQSIEDSVVTSLATSTGMRVSSICLLRHGDIVNQGEFVRINATSTKKRENNDITIYASPEFYELYKQFIDRTETRMGRKIEPQERIFIKYISRKQFDLDKLNKLNQFDKYSNYELLNKDELYQEFNNLRYYFVQRLRRRWIKFQSQHKIDGKTIAYMIEYENYRGIHIHGFRKFFHSTMMKHCTNSSVKSYLMGWTDNSLERTYTLDSALIPELEENYRKALPHLMINTKTDNKISKQVSEQVAEQSRRIDEVMDLLRENPEILEILKKKKL
jgi:integrase